MIKSIFKQTNKAFIPFIMAGHPSMEETKQAILALSEIGADIIELGVPFSDPVADGITNQRAAELALQQGANLEAILDLVKSIREGGCSTPIILFSYFNPILAFGDTFAREAKASGIDGVLVVDLPPEEGEAFYSELQSFGLEVVLLTSPTSNPSRFKQYQRIDPAFIYYISRLSVTGIQEALSPKLADELQTLRTHFPNHPIAVGFGISTPEQARSVAMLADGVVVGSLLVKTLELKGLEAFRALSQQFVQAIHIG